MSNVSCGIVGLPNVGKSTLFNSLTGSQVLAANYPFATIEPNTGVVLVPDRRLKKLAEIYKTEKVIPATVTFVDIAGLVKGASEGEGLGNQFLSHIRRTNAIIQVVRAFQDPNVTHVDIAHDPVKDIDVINTELILADLQTLEKRIGKLEKEARVNNKLQASLNSCHQAKELLDAGQPLWDSSEVNHEHIADLQLLTAKPIIYIFNVDEATLSNKEHKQSLEKIVAPNKALFICAKLENELQGLDETDTIELLMSYGVQESGLAQLVHATYDTLGLQSYLTAGPKEVRAWTIPKGATAPQAAGVIHSDFEHGFIAAQIINYNDLIAAGSESAARAAGKVRTEGKNYTMQPDDIVEFRFNVSK